eukprot:jgi/Phyca11/130259/e_gw1.92.58.1
MVALPDDLFDDMSSLTFIHFAAFIPVVKLPSFKGLTNLKSLTLATFLYLSELPAFDSLHNLERLQSFTTFDRGAWCCNGFLNKCELSDPKCGVHPVWGTPAATCLASENQANEATRAITTKFSFSICGPAEAMCYNVRFMGITCAQNRFAIEMRRRQIAQGVGDACDPEIETWLGCK